jgi:hypothetical protein
MEHNYNIEYRIVKTKCDYNVTNVHADWGLILVQV